MSRKSTGKLSSDSIAELRRQIKRYNAKLSREAKKSPELVDFLPEKLTMKKLKNVKTAADVRLIKNQVNRLFKPNVLKPVTTPQGVKTTKYEIRELKLGVARINRAREKERREGEPSPERGTMGSIQENNLRPKIFDQSKITPRDWKMFVESVEKQSMSSYPTAKMETYKQNYLTAIRHEFGSLSDELIKRLENVPARNIVKNYYANPLLQIDFVYGLEDAELRLETLLVEWGDVMNWK